MKTQFEIEPSMDENRKPDRDGFADAVIRAGYAARAFIATHSNITIGFGKYESHALGDIPLRYLDETISVMPPTWVTRIAAKYVDSAMELAIIHGFNLGGDAMIGRVPNLTISELQASMPSDKT